MKKSLFAAGLTLVLMACAGQDSVVTVDGVSFDVEDIPIETDASSVDLATFRNALNWVIRDQVLTTAAADEFGITFDTEQLNAQAAAALDGLSPTDRLDPRANIDYFLIQARVGVAGLLWPEIAPLLPADVSQNEWAIERLAAAEIDVAPRYGEWRTTPEPLVYEP